MAEYPALPELLQEGLFRAFAAVPAGGGQVLAKAAVEGLLPFRQALGEAPWLAEALAALGELGPVLEAAAASFAGAAAIRSPSKRSEELRRAAELVRLASYARLCVPWAEARGRIAPPSASILSPYDGSRLDAAELGRLLAPPGPGERHRLALARYAAALAQAKGVSFAALALAAEARTLEPGELWFATTFRELCLHLKEKKGVDIGFAAAIVRDAFPRNGFGQREAVLALADFLVDERYSAQAIEPLLSFIRGCALLLHPDRTAAFATVLRLAKDFVRLSRSTDESYFRIILNTYLESPYLDLAEWVGEGARIVRVSGGDSNEARAFFDRSSEESRKIWESIDVGIAFEKAEPRLGPFVAALAGRKVTLARNEASEGNAFMTDGETIFVPAYAMYVRDRESNYLMLRHGAAHECAHIEFDSFLADEGRFRDAAWAIEGLFPGAWARNESLGKSYRSRLWRSLERAGYEARSLRFAGREELPPLARLYFMTDYPMLYRDVLNIVEDRRVNSLLYDRYPGYQAERSRVDGIDLEALPALEDFPEEARFIQAFLERLLLGSVKGELPARDQDALAGLLGLAEAQDPFATDVFDSSVTAARALVLIVAHLGGAYPRALARLRAADNRLDLDLASLGVSKGRRNGLLEFELKELREAEGVEGASRAAASSKAAAFGEALRDFGQIRSPNVLGGRSLFVYPEWVDWKLAYDREACLLAEFPPGFEARLSPLGSARREQAPGRGEALRSRELHAAEAVRRAFASMKENLDVLERGAEDGDDIDFDRAVDCFMDYAAGGSVDMDFYLRRSRKSRDLLCALVLDMSPSTAQVVEGRSVFDHEVSAAYLMAEAMSSIGDCFGLFSYYDFGARANIFHVIKDFDAPYDSAVVDSLAGLRSAESGFSRMAPGLRHIMAKMRSREARAKIVFLVTDGQPVYLDSISDEGRTSKTYWVDGHEVVSPVPVRVRSLSTASDDYAYADLRKTAEEARLAGIHLFCVTLDGESLLPLSRVFGEELIYLDRVAALPSRLVEIFRKMTR